MNQAELERPYNEDARWQELYREALAHYRKVATHDEIIEAIVRKSSTLGEILLNDELSFPDAYLEALDEYFQERAENDANEGM